MIALIGGAYNGEYVDRPRLAPGSTLAVTADGDTEIYRMRNDGCAEAIADGERPLIWDESVKPYDVRDHRQHGLRQ